MDNGGPTNLSKEEWRELEKKQTLDNIVQPFKESVALFIQSPHKSYKGYVEHAKRIIKEYNALTPRQKAHLENSIMVQVLMETTQWRDGWNTNKYLEEEWSKSEQKEHNNASDEM